MDLRSFSLRFIACAGLGAFVASSTVDAGAATRMVVQRPVYASHVVYTLSGTTNGAAGIGIDAKFCKTFPNLCIEQGGTGQLNIQLNCTQNSQPVSCGTVTWSATTSSPQLTASFNPNPGPAPNGQSTETVTSAPGQKPGKNYSQTISWSCTGISNCTGSAPAKIHVTK